MDGKGQRSEEESLVRWLLQCRGPCEEDGDAAESEGCAAVQWAGLPNWWQEAAWGSRNAEATCDREASREEAGKTVGLVAVPRAQEERTCV